jgi:hypothetical protein
MWKFLSIVFRPKSQGPDSKTYCNLLFRYLLQKSSVSIFVCTIAKCVVPSM